jgi:hypothetical protein
VIKTISAEDVVVDHTPHSSTPNERNSGEGTVIASAPYFGSNQAIARGPQGFYVDFGPEFMIHPHFHRVDQFQIVVRGTGKIGKHSLDPVTVHYTDGFTPYGPIDCGKEGMAFFNFRSHSDVGAYPMPASKAELERKAGRSFTEHTWFDLGGGDRGRTRMEALIDLQDDGLATYELIAAPGANLPDDVVGGACRYQLVLGGSLVFEDRELPERSAVFASAGEVLSHRRAGAGGLHLLQVQLPYA